jgi:hypothetical protein
MLLLLFQFSGSAKLLSPQAEISLITCSPGNEIHSFFGHTAIRVNDPVYKTDYIFNYGVFSFSAPNFVYRFAKGETDYQLGVPKYNIFVNSYKRDKRSVFEQKINLTRDEKQKLYDALIENYKPENRVYRYNFFFDNCSSRVRDMIEAHVSDNFAWVYEEEASLTFREIIEKYIPGNTWIDLGIKIALGIAADNIITPYEKMFIPDYVMLDFKNAIIIRDGIGTPLCEPVKTIYKAPEQSEKSSLTSPNIIILLITSLIVLVTVIGQISNKHKIGIDFFVYLFFGIAGLIVSFLTFASEHPATEWNLNLIWAFPTHFVFAFLMLKNSWQQKLKIYHRFTAIILMLFLISMTLLPQSFHWLVIPLSLILLARATKNGWFVDSGQ